MYSYIPVLSIAGSDSSGGAGIQADIKTISAIGCYAETVVTAITAQNTTGVKSIMGVEPGLVADQLEMVFGDIPPLAVKTGMLFSGEIVSVVVDFFKSHEVNNLIVDPVMISTSGSKLMNDDAINQIVERLLPMSSLITPNRMEAETITGETDVKTQIKRFRELGCRNILIKGGHDYYVSRKTDYLALEGCRDTIILSAESVDTRNSHGTGCTLSSAIASYLAIGMSLERAVKCAKRYITKALLNGKDIKCGEGSGPVNHAFSPQKMKCKRYVD